ncbi:MAG: hypothetical protein RDV48_00105 [Candidatus Eremiobacteraeota bacterium]|nr:hypothetical protein [Candidatus Eremiobacteraeota bacterium]
MVWQDLFFDRIFTRAELSDALASLFAIRQGELHIRGEGSPEPLMIDIEACDSSENMELE